MISFSDEEIGTLTSLASALPWAQREGFLEHVASRLKAHPMEARGPGLLHRIGAEVQYDYLKHGIVAVGTNRPRLHKHG